MARERTQNGGVTALTGTIDNSTTSVTVANGNVLATLPQFRIIIDAEVLLVTSIAGNILTVVRGAEGTATSGHSDGAIVAQIMTRDGIRRYLQDWTNPFFDEPTAYPQQVLDSLTQTLDDSDFTWTNQGSASVGLQSNGGLFYNINSSATDSMRLSLRTLTSPWKVTCTFAHLWMGGTSPSVGMCIADSGAGTFKTWGIEGLNSYKQSRWTNPTTFSSSPLNFTSLGSRSKIWFQLEDDGVDHFFRISMDGVNFLEVLQETRTTHTATPDRVGLFFNNLNTGQDMLVNIHSWIEE